MNLTSTGVGNAYIIGANDSVIVNLSGEHD